MLQIDDIDKWLEAVEAELASDDHGRDLRTVEELIKKVLRLAA